MGEGRECGYAGLFVADSLSGSGSGASYGVVEFPEIRGATKDR